MRHELYGWTSNLTFIFFLKTIYASFQKAILKHAVVSDISSFVRNHVSRVIFPQNDSCITMALNILKSKNRSLGNSWKNNIILDSEL